MLYFACSTEYFPLTLALSPQEREQPVFDSCAADGCWANSGTGVIERRWTVLPLPRGEGRGEGEPSLVWCLRNNYTFVALKLAWGEARGRECIPSDTRPTEQRSPRSISAQPEGRHVFWAEALLLAPHRSTSGYALVPVRKHLAPSLRPKSIAANV